MWNKKTKYILMAAILLIVAYNSVYFKSLEEVKASAKSARFNAAAYAENYWSNHLVPRLGEAMVLNELFTLIQKNKKESFRKYSNAMGIGNIRYFLVKGEGKVLEVKENEVSIAIPAEKGTIEAIIATEFIYGNTVRDAIGGLNINDFDNTMHLNQLSEEINKKIREQVVPPFRAQVKKGGLVHFTGAIELNQKYLDLENVEIIPVELNFQTLNP